ncbi:RHS repeat protein [Clostridiaceae bacterium Marseille-Q3526]|nr:RHS repeat protein [Clostridiaceae bacterium Marseille-Q3526]
MGNLTETISPKRAKTAYTYDKNGELTSQTDPAGNMILYQVDFTEPGSLPSRQKNSRQLPRIVDG